MPEKLILRQLPHSKNSIFFVNLWNKIRKEREWQHINDSDALADTPLQLQKSESIEQQISP